MIRKATLFFRPGLCEDTTRAQALTRTVWLVQATLHWGWHHCRSTEFTRFNPIAESESRALHKYYDVCHTTGSNHLEIFKEAQRLEFHFKPHPSRNDMVTVEINYFNRGRKGCSKGRYLETTSDSLGRFWDTSSVGF